MNGRLGPARTERGVALPLALFVLVMLSGLLLALLSMAGMEPTVAANLNDLTRARFVAEAGIEWGYDKLAACADEAACNALWDTLLSTNAGKMATDRALDGLTAASGTFSVTVRNDILAGDTPITGELVVDVGGANDDQNRIVILTSTGTYNGATRQIQEVVRYNTVPSLPGPLNLPGLGNNTRFQGNTFTIDGRDHNLDGSPGACAPRPGISVFDPASEAAVENPTGWQTKNKENVKGKPQNGVADGKDAYGDYGWKDNAITPDPSLTPQTIKDFVDGVKRYADIRLQASASSPLKFENVGSTCSKDLNDGLCWGTISPDPAKGTAGRPRIIYVKGTVDPLQAFYAVTISGTSQGAGILIIEDGDLKITGNFRWEGLIVVTGQYSGLYYGGGGEQTIYGGIVVNETLPINTEVEVDATGNAKILLSCQALANLRNMRGKLFPVTSWREL